MPFVPRPLGEAVDHVDRARAVEDVAFRLEVVWHRSVGSKVKGGRVAQYCVTTLLGGGRACRGLV